ncbi:MAG: class I SAM-dependent methyltransferase [Chloroflexi bacterium]|nr:class I SAM-dependent methyltransferase [Chloroflexota bacterium]
MTSKRLPSGFLQELSDLEAAYLREDDPIRQSGFGGGPERWRAERAPILDAVESDGDLLDIGCANGYLLECLVAWGRERGLRLTPYGLDQGARLIALAKQRLPEFGENFFVGNAWDWEPPRRFRYVYMLYDCVPPNYLADWLNRSLESIVAPGGRLIVGAYGSRSRGIPPFDIAGFIEAMGLEMAGASTGGEPPLTAFAWVDS